MVYLKNVRVCVQFSLKLAIVLPNMYALSCSYFDLWDTLVSFNCLCPNGPLGALM